MNYLPWPRKKGPDELPHTELIAGTLAGYGFRGRGSVWEGVDLARVRASNVGCRLRLLKGLERSGSHRVPATHRAQGHWHRRLRHHPCPGIKRHLNRYQVADFRDLKPCTLHSPFEPTTKESKLPLSEGGDLHCQHPQEDIPQIHELQNQKGLGF